MKSKIQKSACAQASLPTGQAGLRASKISEANHTVKQALFVLALMAGALTLFSFAAHAAILNPTDAPGSVTEATGGQSSLRGLILTIVDYFLGFLGLLAVIMVVYGGVTYVSSAGNDEAVGKAKKIIMYALIGIIIILLSFVVVRAVLGSGTGTE